MVGQALGANLPERAEEAVWTATRANALLLGLVGVFFVIFARPLVGLFTQDAAVADVATYGLRAIAKRPDCEAAVTRIGFDTRIPLCIVRMRAEISGGPWS